MKIGIDVSQVAYPGTGSAIYTKNLVSNLLKIDNNNSYKLFAGSWRRGAAIRNIFPQTRLWPLPPTALDLLWNRLGILNVENLIGPVDVFHSSDWTQAPTKAAKVTTIHDLVVYKYPETLHPQIVSVHKRRLARVKKECDVIIAVSQNTKKDIVEILGISENKIKVVYEAVGESFTKYKKTPHSGRPYILTVGTREPRKNLDRLVEAFSKIKNKDVELVIVGKYGWGTEISNKQSTINNKIKLLGYVPQEKLLELYANAEAFVYPSLYEGFGIPVLEAMTVGCAVITSSISSMSEVGGKAAIYVTPTDINDMAQKIDWVLELSSSQRSDLISKGYQQAKKFSWEKAARETLKIYEEVVCG